MTVATLSMPSPSSVSFQMPEVDRIPCPPNLDYTQQTHQKNRRPRSRDRDVILTLQGWHKLQTAEVQAEFQENAGDRFTSEELSERTDLSLGTCEYGENLSMFAVF